MLSKFDTLKGFEKFDSSCHVPIIDLQRELISFLPPGGARKALSDNRIYSKHVEAPEGYIFKRMCVVSHEGANKLRELVMNKFMVGKEIVRGLKENLPSNKNCVGELDYEISDLTALAQLLDGIINSLRKINSSK